MPSHIFTRVGAWAESAATNERSALASQRHNDPAGQLHAMDFMLYAYLQLARDSDARRVVEDAARIPGADPTRINPYPIAAIPARYALERGDWRQATMLQPPGSKWLTTTDWSGPAKRRPLSLALGLRALFMVLSVGQ